MGRDGLSVEGLLGFDLQADWLAARALGLDDGPPTACVVLPRRRTATVIVRRRANLRAEAALLTPDVVVIESNHAGHVHAHTIAKKTGIPIVTRYTGARGAEKHDLYRGIPGLQYPFAKNQIHIWCGDEHNRGFATTLCDELHQLPNGAHDDTVMMLWHAWAVARGTVLRDGDGGGFAEGDEWGAPGSSSVAFPRFLPSECTQISLYGSKL